MQARLHPSGTPRKFACSLVAADHRVARLAAVYAAALAAAAAAGGWAGTCTRADADLLAPLRRCAPGSFTALTAAELSAVAAVAAGVDDPPGGCDDSLLFLNYLYSLLYSLYFIN
jgi:hypothetical protein